MNSNSSSNIDEGSKTESYFSKSIKFVLYKYKKAFNKFINYEDKPFESEILLNQCIYNFNIKHLLTYLSYNIRSTFLYAKDTIYLMFLLNKNMSIVLKYLINSLLFVGLFFVFLLILSVLVPVYVIIGIISFILFVITFPFRFTYKILFKKNKKNGSGGNKSNKNSRSNKNAKINPELKKLLNKKRRISRIKRNIKQQMILKLIGNYENIKVKRTSKIKAIFLKLLNQVNAIFIKLNKQLQIKFIDTKVTSYNKHVVKGLKSRTRLIASAFGKRDYKKESLFANKYYFIKTLSSMVKALDKTSSCLKPKDKERFKEAKYLVTKEFKKELKVEKEKIKKVKLSLNKTKSKVKSKTLNSKVKTSGKINKMGNKLKKAGVEEMKKENLEEVKIVEDKSGKIKDDVDTVKKLFVMNRKSYIEYCRTRESSNKLGNNNFQNQTLKSDDSEHKVLWDNFDQNSVKVEQRHRNLALEDDVAKDIDDLNTWDSFDKQGNDNSKGKDAEDQLELEMWDSFDENKKDTELTHVERLEKERKGENAEIARSK